MAGGDERKERRVRACESGALVVARRGLVLVIAALITFTPAQRGPGDAFVKPPSEFRTKAELESWIEKHKGFGVPEWTEFRLNGIHLFVAWVGPFSGRPGNVSWCYRRSFKRNRWLLLDTSVHDEPRILSHVGFDRAKSRLLYYGVKGSMIKSLDVKPLLYK